MSNELDKEQHSKRIHQKEVKIRKQLKIAKVSGINKYLQQPHRLNKHHAMDCGNPDCFMCSNPRKTLGEITIQEKRFYQIDE